MFANNYFDNERSNVLEKIVKSKPDYLNKTGILLQVLVDSLFHFQLSARIRHVGTGKIDDPFENAH